MTPFCTPTPFSSGGEDTAAIVAVVYAVAKAMAEKANASQMEAKLTYIKLIRLR